MITNPKRITLLTLGALIITALAWELPHLRVATIDQLVEQVSTEEMGKRATAVIDGTVTRRLGTVREPDPTGRDMVYTRWEIEVRRNLKGTAGQTAVVRTLGGQYGLTLIDVDDQPRFRSGDRVVLFLRQIEDWKGEYRTVGEYQGKFSLRQKGGVTEAVQSETNTSLRLDELERASKQ